MGTEKLKCATVSVIGRPSCGKSTFLNSICENKVAITSPVPQTTRNRIKGIYTDVRGQLVFIDTPGLHDNGAALNRRLREIAVTALRENDLVLYMIDATRAPGPEERDVSRMAAQCGRPVVICVNKKDLATQEQIDRTLEYLAEVLPGNTPLVASALEDSGLDEVLIALFAAAPQAPLLYPGEEFTDQDLDFRVSEIIREKAMEGMRAELPHSVFVEVEDLQMTDDNLLLIRAAINVERDSQKGIIVGSGGSNIKRIRTEAAKDIRRIFPGRRLNLDIRVKVSPNWRRNQSLLKSMIK